MSATTPSLIDPARRPIGASGLTSGPLAFGCWRFTHRSVHRAQAVVEAAVGAGMTLVDTADIYGLGWGGEGFGAAEELLGRVFATRPSLREQLVVATKGGIRPPLPYDSSGRRLREACEGSLRRLRVNVIDLYQVHRPDLFAHPGEVAATLVALQTEGKVREIGVSNYTVHQHDALVTCLAAHGAALATTQPELSALRLDALRDGTLDRCLAGGITPLAWSPLAGGALATGEGVRPELLAVLDELAGREGVDRAAVAIAFVLAHPSRPVAILGSQSPERLAAATRALAVRLDRHDCYRVVEASDGVPLP
jgi:predicted oxidoreductase